MPFESKSQMRWMFANKPEMAKKWADHTPDTKHLPEKKKLKKSEIVHFVILEKALDNEYFKVERADDCIWLTDKRGKKALIIHLVPDQAKEVGEELLNISKSRTHEHTFPSSSIPSGGVGGRLNRKTLFNILNKRR